MKKIKNFFFSFVPLLLGFCIQYMVCFYLMLLSALFMFVIAPSVNGYYAYSINDLIDLWVNIDFNTLIMLVFAVICITIFGLWYYKSCGRNFRINIAKTFHPLQIIGIVLLIPGTQFLSSLLISYISVIFPSWLETYEELMEMAGLNEDISLFMMIYSICLAPISEELIFRGVTLRVARRTFPFWIANIFQALLFGVFHMNMVQGCYAFVLGLILGYICEAGGSIYFSILFHFLFNLWGTMASEFLKHIHPALMGILIIVGAIGGTFGGLYLFKKGTSALKYNHKYQ
ncbi:MAG: CPBP family intramembrane metalloprotease [Lachnospiraceae bacterium]|nr:CPBP family intramembrane metalloprotease [Lachnospiraceae bacterium]